MTNIAESKLDLVCIILSAAVQICIFFGLLHHEELLLIPVSHQIISATTSLPQKFFLSKAPYPEDLSIFISFVISVERLNLHLWAMAGLYGGLFVTIKQPGDKRQGCVN